MDEEPDSILYAEYFVTLSQLTKIRYERQHTYESTTWIKCKWVEVEKIMMKSN